MGTAMLESNLLSVLMLVALLGFRHGFDADHIAVIDGMTRARQLRRGAQRGALHRYWATRWVGAQFAMGHSLVILLVSLLMVGQSTALPTWLDGLGLVVSTVFLLAIAGANMAHALRVPKGSLTLAPTGALSAALLRLTGGQLHPAWVGMAFAISFDAFGQAAFFASRGHAFSSTAVVVLLAGVFGAGMLLADATNGALLSGFAQRSDTLVQRASRWSSCFIACVALLTAAAGLARAVHADFAQAWDDAGAWVGVGLAAFVFAAFLLRLQWVRLALQRASPRAAN